MKMRTNILKKSTQDQIMLRAFPMSLTGAASRWLRNKPSGSIKTWEDLKEVILFYNGLEVLTSLILDSKGAIPTKTTVDAKVAIQDMAEYSQKWHNGTSQARSTKNSNGLAAIQAQLNNLGKEIKKVNEKVYAAQVGCEQCKGPYYTKDCLLKEEGKTLEEAYYTQFSVPFQQGGKYRAAAPGFYQRNNANPSFQERRQSMEESLSKFLNESAKIHKENSNLIMEIRASTDAAIRNQGASIKTLEIQIGKISKVLQERGFGSLTNSTETNPRDHVKSIPTIVEVDMTLIRRIGSSQYVVSAQQNNMLMFESRQATILFPSRLNDYYYYEKNGSSLEPLYEEYIELNDLNVPLELRRDQVDDLMPTIEKGELVDKHMIEELKTRDDNKMVSKIFGYPNDYDKDEKIHIDCAYNLKFLCMIGLEFLYASFFSNLPINFISKKFCNSIMKDKIEFRGRNELGNFAIVLVFIGNFYVITDFTVVEDMHHYLDEGI
ncbi:hypothetical protein Tco_0277701 [Tanacetum coccineum]